MNRGKESSRDSMIRNLDPGAKLICFSLLIVALCCTSQFVGYGVILAFLLALAYLSRLQLHQTMEPICHAWLLLLVVVLLNALLGSHDLGTFRLGSLLFSLSGIRNGLYMVFRLGLLLMMVSLLLKTEAPVHLLGSLAALLRPLGLPGLWLCRLSDCLILALNFIPLLLSDAHAIKLAQRGRGIGFKNRRFLDRAEVMRPLVIPLFVRAFQRADRLSLALTMKGYSFSRQQLPAVSLAFSKRDWLAISVCATLCALQILVF